jgi:tight adherence protein C
MTSLGSLAVGLLVHQAIRYRRPGRRAFWIAVSAALVTAGSAGPPIAGIMWASMLIRTARARAVAAGSSAGLDHLGQVLFIALSAGLPVAAALEFSTHEVGPAQAGEIRSVLREARHHGLAAALTAADGTAGRLFTDLAMAQLTGAPAVKAVASFVDEERRERRTRAAEAAQRLPVKLTVPLALLILPGFVLLIFGPTVISTVQRLLGPLLS